jgi:hypothetical protein
MLVTLFTPPMKNITPETIKNARRLLDVQSTHQKNGQLDIWLNEAYAFVLNTKRRGSNVPVFDPLLIALELQRIEAKKYEPWFISKYSA